MENSIIKLLTYDIGGTKIQTGIFLDDKIINEKRFETKLDPIERLNQIVEIYNQYKNEHVDIEGIAIACPNPIENGVILKEINLFGWDNLNIQAELEKMINKKIRIFNDAQAAAWGEYKFGNYKKTDYFLMITIGTGIGGGIVLNGNSVRGPKGSAGEIGHFSLIPNGRLCNCGKLGCAEAYLSGNSLLKILKENNFNFDNLSQLFNKETLNNNQILNITNTWIDQFGYFLGSTINLLGFDVIVLGGGVSKTTYYWFDKLTNELDKYCFPHLAKNVKIYTANLTSEGPLLGAGSLFLEE